MGLDVLFEPCESSFSCLGASFIRAYAFALGACAALAAATASAHGPQIQITNDAGKIGTRQLLVDAPYSGALTANTLVYVMPLVQFNSVLYSQPNGTIDPV